MERLDMHSRNEYLKVLRERLRRLRYIGNTSGMIESMEDLPEKVIYGKEKLLLFQKETHKIKEQACEVERSCGTLATFSKRKVKGRMDDILLYSSEPERKSHCQAFWYIREDFS